MEKERGIRGYGLEKIPASVLSYYGAGEEVLCQMTGKKISKAACLELGRAYRQNQRFCVNCNSIYRLRPECILQGLPEAAILFADFEKYAFFSTGNGDGDGKESESKQQPERKLLVLKSSSSQRNSQSQSQQELKFWCPEYQEEISRERCLNNCSHLQKNRQACSALNCASPWRLCLVCTELKPVGFSFLENLGIVKKCAAISPTPYCGVHLNDRKKIPDFFINQIAGNPKPVKKRRRKESGHKV